MRNVKTLSNPTQKELNHRGTNTACHCQQSLYCSGRIDSQSDTIIRKKKNISPLILLMPGCIAQLWPPCCHTQHAPQPTSCRRNTVVLKAQGVSKPFSRPRATIHTKLNHPVVACYCHYLSGWRSGVSYGVMVIPNTKFPGNCEAVLPMLYSVTGST